MNREQLQQELEKVADKLLVISETDAPLRYVFLEKPADDVKEEEFVVAWAGKPAGKEVETEDLDHFFRNMTDPDPAAGQELLDKADRYKKLVATLKEHLVDVKVYRIKEQVIDVYILGKTPEGDYAGYETLVVET